MKQYSRRDFAQTLGLGAVAMTSSGPAPAARRPNVVFILADDLGWRYTTLYGNKYYETPNIERLARRGMMFDQAYAAAPICSPTRAGILTGLYPARIGIIQPSGARKDDWKLIRFWFDGDNQRHRFELYNLKEDIGETTNLADKMPEKVKALDGMIDRFLADTHAVTPKPNPSYKPGAGKKAARSIYDLYTSDDMA